MKTGETTSKLSFGFATVNAGQRAVNHEPQLIAVSTDGAFRITPPVSSALGLAHGDHIMFVNNLPLIDNAIRLKDPAIVEFCEANGLDITDPAASIAIHRAFDAWGIAKGLKEYDPKGNVKTGPERLTKNDRERYVKQNFAAMLEAALASGNEELVAALSRDGITEAEQIEVLIPFVQPKEVEKYQGSKAANTAGMTGTGVSLSFTDSNVWAQLKLDLKENASKLNRVYDIDLDSIQKVSISNGYQEVECNVLMLGAHTDVKPAGVGTKKEESTDATATTSAPVKEAAAPVEVAVEAAPVEDAPLEA